MLGAGLHKAGSKYTIVLAGVDALLPMASMSRGTALTEAQLPAHTHDSWGTGFPSGSWTGGTGTTQTAVNQASGSTASGSTLRTLSTGSGSTHTHTFSGNAATIATLSPYIVVNYIIKT